MRIELHIDSLVLDGWPLNARQGDDVQAAIEQELTRLLGSGNFDAYAAVALPTLSCGSIDVGRATPPGQLGARLATALHSALVTLDSGSPASPAWHEAGPAPRASGEQS